MTDRLMKLYELNEQYHDTKERRAWLATIFYAAFCLAMFRWAINIKNETFLQGYPFPIIALLGVIAACVFFFTWFQYRKKRASQKIEEFIAKELSVHNGDDHDQLARVFAYKNEVHEPRRRRTVKQGSLSTEIYIFVLMIALFLAQVLVILIVSGTWPLIVNWFTKWFAG